MPTPTWNMTFAVTDDWTHKDYVNMFFAAVFERLKVFSNQPSYPSGGGPMPATFVPGAVGTTRPTGQPNPPTVQLYVPAGPGGTPAAIPATDLQSCYSGGKGSGDPGVAPFHPGSFARFQVAELQSLILSMVNSGVGAVNNVWVDPTYVLAGQPSPSLPTDLFLTAVRVGAILGYPTYWGSGSPDPGYELFRRVRARQIFSISGNTACDQFFARPGLNRWNLYSSPVAATVGMKAEFHDTAGATFSTFADDACPGIYKGIYEYQGGGTWTPAAAGSSPDLMDSNQVGSVVMSGFLWGPNFVAPGPMLHGDYFGPWIWTQMRDVLNLLVWTTVGIANTYNCIGGNPASAANYLPSPWADSSTPNHVLEKSVFSSVSEADAYSQLAAATAVSGSSGNQFVPSFPRSFTTWSGGSFFGIFTDSCLFGVPGLYQGLYCDVDTWLATAGNGGETTDATIYDDQGTGLPFAQWSLWQTDAHAAGDDVFDQFICSKQFGPFATPPFPAAPLPTNNYGMQICNELMIAKWDRSGGFTYTRGAPY